jgi:hypothetical protein
MDLAAFKTDARHFGVTRALLRAGYYRAHAACGVRLFRYLVLEAGDINPELLARAVPYECRILDDDEIPRLVRDPDDPTIGGTGRAGDLCFAVLDGTTLASVGWYASRPTRVHRTLTVSFDPRYAYMYAGYTAPGYRGQNLHGIGLARATQALCARGYAGIVSIAESVNFASLASCDRAGFRRCGTALALPLGSRTFIRQTRAAARYGLRLAPVGADGVREAAA